MPALPQSPPTEEASTVIERASSGLLQERVAARAALRVEALTATRVRDSHLGYPYLARLERLHADLAKQIDDDLRRGATCHDRVPVLVRAIPAVIAVLDWVVLFPYCADIVNADLSSAWSVATLAAGLLALLGSGTAYVILSRTGVRLRGYRTQLGEVAWREVGTTTWLMIGGSVVVALALAVLMYLRVTGQVIGSPEPVMAVNAALISVVFAALNMAANLAIVAVHVLDGSAQSALLRRTGCLLHRREQALQRAARSGLD